MNKHANDMKVQATVIDADTIRYGGSEFKRERTCKLWSELSHTGDHSMTYTCLECKGIAAVIPHAGSMTPLMLKAHIPRYCSNCGARVERDA